MRTLTTLFVCLSLAWTAFVYGIWLDIDDTLAKVLLIEAATSTLGIAYCLYTRSLK